MVDWDVFMKVHSGMARQGPGDDASTERAYRMIDAGDAPLIADIGCGPGMQTRKLASMGADVFALDFFTQYLQELRAEDPSIPLIQGDMNSPPLKTGLFDIVWSEGAIYIMGFKHALRQWGRYLKEGGYIAVTEVTWLSDDTPCELREFWESGYPAITDIEGNLKTLREAGYEPLGHFPLPEKSWYEDYYDIIRPKAEAMMEEYSGDDDATKTLQAELDEITLFEKYSDFYGYVFYIMRKDSA